MTNSADYGIGAPGDARRPDVTRSETIHHPEISSTTPACLPSDRLLALYLHLRRVTITRVGTNAIITGEATQPLQPFVFLETSDFP